MISIVLGKEGNMDSKTNVDVVISGKQYTVSGYESNEYIQKVVLYVNERISEFKEKIPDYDRMDKDMQSLLFAINLADDYFKAQEREEELRSEKKEIETEIFEIKHKLLEMQNELKEMGEAKEKLEQEKVELEEKIVRLETENQTRDKKHGRR